MLTARVVVPMAQMRPEILLFGSFIVVAEPNGPCEPVSGKPPRMSARDFGRRQEMARRRASHLAGEHSLAADAQVAFDDAREHGQLVAVFVIGMPTANPSQARAAVSEAMKSECESNRHVFGVDWDDEGHGTGFVRGLNTRADCHATIVGLAERLSFSVAAVGDVAVGYAISDSDNPTAALATEGAKIALGHADPGRPVVAYASSMRGQTRTDILTDLTQLRDRLGASVRVQYQPIVSLDTGDVTGVEALARLHVDGEIIVPADFLPVLDQAGMLVDLGLHVVRRIVADLESLPGIGDDAPPIWVNLSVPELTSLRQSGLLDALWSAPHAIGIEFRESSGAQLAPADVRTLTEISASGVPLAVDGYNSDHLPLGRLASMGIRQVKIDPLALNAPLAARHNDFLPAFVEFLDRIGMTPIALAVEGESGLEVAREAGIKTAQGFVTGIPTESAGRVEAGGAQWTAGDVAASFAAHRAETTKPVARNAAEQTAADQRAAEDTGAVAPGTPSDGSTGRAPAARRP